MWRLPTQINTPTFQVFVAILPLQVERRVVAVFGNESICEELGVEIKAHHHLDPYRCISYTQSAVEVS